MTHWILMLWMTGGGGMFAVPANFNAEQACHEAGKIWGASAPNLRVFGYTCLPIDTRAR